MSINKKRKLNSILIIEDDELTASLYHMLIDDLSICEEIKIKTDSVEGLDYIVECCMKADCPELIFIDIKMPGLDGFDLIQELNKLRLEYIIESKIIILTSSSFFKDIERAKDLKVDNYIVKPLSRDKLSKIIEEHFEI